MDLMDERIRAALRRGFEQRFGAGRGALRCALAPGRVNLIGEHTDYNGGFVLPLAIARHTAAVFRPSARPRLSIHSATIAAHGGEADDEFGLTRGGIPRRPGHWANYVRGVAAALLRRGIKLKGGEIYLAADLPFGAGLSSSASLEVAAGLALLALSGRRLAPQALALACQEAEHTYVGIRCGIMDQTVVARARAGHALLLDCRDLSVRHVPIRLHGWGFAVFDTGVRHKLAASEYNQRRAECEHAARVCGVPTLREATVDHLLKFGHRLSLDEHRRVRHVLSENLRTLAFRAALEHGDAAWLGRILNEGHASLTHDYGVSCRELNVLAGAATAPGGPAAAACPGARMTGGGFGGSIVALVRNGKFAALRRRVAREYRRTCGRELGGAALVEPSGGARIVAL